MYSKWIGTLLVVISAMTFGSIPIFSNFAYKEGVPVSTLLFLRFLTASLILWTYIKIKKVPYKISNNIFKNMILIGLIGYGGSSSGIFYSYKYISSSLATIILYTYPIIVVIYEIITRKEKSNPKKIICLFTTTLGLILVVCTGPMKINGIGIVLAFLATITYAYFCIGVGDGSIQKLRSVVISAYVMSVCAIFYFLQCIFTKNVLLPPNTKGLFYAIMIAIVCSIIPTITLYEGIKRIGVGTSAIISTFEPFFVCILGTVCLNEKITMNMIIGGMIIIISLIVLQAPAPKFLNKSKRYSYKG